MIPLNIPGHSHWTSHQRRCIRYHRSVFHWSNMSRKESHDGVGVDFSAFRSAAAGLVFKCSGCGGWSGWRVLVWTISSCVGGRTMVSPGRPCGSSWWWRMCSCKARSESCCQLGHPTDRCRLTGGQLRPTDRAMAARSARTTSSEEDAETTDEENRLLTKRCIERQWKTLV